MSVNVFTESEKQEFLAEDRPAWNAICGILLTIIGLGVCIALFALFIISLYG